MEAMKRTVDELRIINDALVQDIKRLKKENAGLKNNFYQITKKFAKVSKRDSFLSIGDNFAS